MDSLKAAANAADKDRLPGAARNTADKNGLPAYSHFTLWLPCCHLVLVSDFSGVS